MLSVNRNNRYKWVWIINCVCLQQHSLLGDQGLRTMVSMDTIQLSELTNLLWYLSTTAIKWKGQWGNSEDTCYQRMHRLTFITGERLKRLWNWLHLYGGIAETDILFPCAELTHWELKARQRCVNFFCTFSYFSAIQPLENLHSSLLWNLLLLLIDAQ